VLDRKASHEEKALAEAYPDYVDLKGNGDGQDHS
jgi:hypothetical protein